MNRQSSQKSLEILSENSKLATSAPIVTHTVGVAAVDAASAEVWDFGFVPKYVVITPDANTDVSISLDGGDTFQTLTASGLQLSRDLGRQTVNVYAAASDPRPILTAELGRVD